MTRFPLTTAQVQAAIEANDGRKVGYEVAMEVHAFRRTNNMPALGSHTDGELIREALHWAAA